MSTRKLLLAFSGGLDTSAAIPWLKETYHAKVYCYCSDIGETKFGESLREHAVRLGAEDLIFEDLREPFVQDYVFPLLRAGATYQEDYMLGTAVARPLIASRLAMWAKELGCDGVAHGATGKGNDQIRFERGLAFVAPELEVIAPWKIWKFKGRTDLKEYLGSQGCPVDAKRSEFSIDGNLLHTSTEGSDLEDIGGEYRRNLVVGTNPNDAVDIHLEFEQGLLTGCNGEYHPPARLLERLNCLGQAAGYGEVDLVEERFNGVKSRGIYQTPGGSLIRFGLRQLKHLCWSRPSISLGQKLGQDYGDLVYDGLWHSRARESLDAFFQEAAKVLTGTISIRIDKGQTEILARKSPFSLYDQRQVSFESDDAGLGDASGGFCKTVCFPAAREGVQMRGLREHS